MIFLFDNHVHTTYSADSAAKPGDIIAGAKAEGLSGICFTDHWDVGYDSVNRENIVPYEYSRCDLRGLRREGGFSVYCGIEIAPMDHVLDRVREEMADAEFDFVMLSAHYVEDVPQMRYDGFFQGKAKKDAYDRYLSTLISIMGKYYDFDALGHFDYITRYSPYDDPLMRYGEQAEKLDELFSVLIRLGKALEINTGKHNERISGIPLDRRVLERYRELGGELVMLGSDAHRAADVGFKFGDYRPLLIECGFPYAVHYVSRKPVFTKL